MIELILFVLIIGVAWYSYDTRERMRNLANVIDNVNALIDQAIIEDRTRITKLEDGTKRNKR